MTDHPDLPGSPVRVRQRSAAPTQKLVASGLAGALTIILVWAADEFADVAIPTEVAQAITIVVSVVVAYLVPPAERDGIEES